MYCRHGVPLVSACRSTIIAIFLLLLQYLNFCGLRPVAPCNISWLLSTNAIMTSRPFSSRSLILRAMLARQRHGVALQRSGEKICAALTCLPKLLLLSFIPSAACISSSLQASWFPRFSFHLLYPDFLVTPYARDHRYRKPKCGMLWLDMPTQVIRSTNAQPAFLSVVGCATGNASCANMSAVQGGRCRLPALAASTRSGLISWLAGKSWHSLDRKPDLRHHERSQSNSSCQHPRD